MCKADLRYFLLANIDSVLGINRDGEVGPEVRPLVRLVLIGPGQLGGGDVEQ